MSRILFTDIQVFDGTGSEPFRAQVLVEGNRIKTIAKGGKIDAAGAEIVSGGGNTLMPGLVEGHAHLTYPFSIDRTPIKPQSVVDIHLPVELASLVTAHNAKIVLDAGITSAYSAGGTTALMDVTLRDEINAGWIPGPRFRAAGNEGVTTSNDASVSQATDVKTVVDFIDQTAEAKAEIAKFILSGPGFTPDEDRQCMYSDEQLEAAGRRAKEKGIWLSGHARFNAAIKQALRYGWRVIYHADQLDEEALDMMEARKDEIFIGPTIGLLTQFYLGAKHEGQKMGMKKGLDLYRSNTERMLERGIRVMPFGDYGFAAIPHGAQAQDLEYFCTYLGFTPAQALMSTTKWGGELMGYPDLGLVKEGFLADLLLVKGDPTKDITLLKDKANLLMIMKDGKYHKAPARSEVRVAAE